MKNTRILVLAIALPCSAPALADTWVAYTDGRTGGCWVNQNGYMHGCTPQPTTAQPGQQSAKSDRSHEEACNFAAAKLKAAKSDPNRTVDSIRKAQKRYDDLFCD